MVSIREVMEFIALEDGSINSIIMNGVAHLLKFLLNLLPAIVLAKPLLRLPPNPACQLRLNWRSRRAGRE